jgi:hypothetical protein
VLDSVCCISCRLRVVVESVRLKAIKGERGKRGWVEATAVAAAAAVARWVGRRRDSRRRVVVAVVEMDRLCTGPEVKWRRDRSMQRAGRDVERLRARRKVGIADLRFSRNGDETVHAGRI